MYMHILTFISKNGKRIFSAFVLIIIFLFLLSYFDLHYILSNTTPTGGDTPAHNYLAKHLKETFFTRGTVISSKGRSAKRVAQPVRHLPRLLADKRCNRRQVVARI